MISQTKNRVQAIKCKFENLNNEPVIHRSRTQLQLGRNYEKTLEKRYGNGKENYTDDIILSNTNSDSYQCSPKPNMSYLYKTDKNLNNIESKKLLTRQTSDPGKKLHRSHAFRCDRSQKVVSPKRHGSCNGRSETQDFSVKMDKKLSKDRLKQLGNLLEDQMRKENFVSPKNDKIGEAMDVTESQLDSIPDSQVPKHILDQYAKVIKKRKEKEDTDKQDGMTDSGVSSETENLEDEKTGRIKKLMSQFEKPGEPDHNKSNLESMINLCDSNDTIRLEKKNPHLVLTDTLKKALKQPLPPGPPPKKPPRSFASISESPQKQKKDTKKMLEKLEKVLQKREAQTLTKTNSPESENRNIYDICENQTEIEPKDENNKNVNSNNKNDYDIVENTSPKLPKKTPRQVSLSLKQPKEVHYLCTEILDITQRTMPNQNCFKSLNCAITNNSTLSLPYTRLSNALETQCCTRSNEKLNRLSTFLTDKCEKCLSNELEDGFKCHLNCKCRDEKSNFFVNKEHIYDEPFNGSGCATIGARSKVNQYGTLNKTKSLEELRSTRADEVEKIYDIPCDPSRSPTPEPVTPETENSKPKPISDFEKLRQNFETGFLETKKPSERNVEGKIPVKKLRSFEADERELKKNPDRIIIVDEKLVANKLKTYEELETKINVQKMTEARKFATEKPPMKPKPVFTKNKLSKSIENLVDSTNEKKKGMDSWKSRKNEVERKSLSRGDSAQLDVDKENLNKLMNEIYETVTVACNMDNKPGCFPTDQSDSSTSEESVKLTRSLTEKRKNYVRRVSSRVAYLDDKNLRKTRFRHQTSVCSYKSETTDQPYSTFRSWKSFRTSQTNLNLNKDKMERTDSTDSKVNLTDSKGNLLSMDFDSYDSIDKLSIDEKAGCVDIEMSVDREKALFNICLLVGLNYMTGQAYVKSVFPSQVKVPPHIENLVFPETLTATSKGEWPTEGSASQCYSLVLTDERGERAYGYCRRVLPEGTTTCLPLCYCIISKFRAPGFYYKVLQEIESHHGSSEVEIHDLLQQLYETDFPSPGEEITITYRNRHFDLSNKTFRNSVNLGDVLKSKTLPDLRYKNLCDNKDMSMSNNELSDINYSHSGQETTQENKNCDQGNKNCDQGNKNCDQGNQNCDQGNKNCACGNKHCIKQDATSEVCDKNSDYEQIEYRTSEMSDESEMRGRKATVCDTVHSLYDFQNNNGPRKVFLSFEGPKTKILKRGLEPRVEESCFGVALDCLGAGLSVKVFGSLLLERKLIIASDKIGELSSCMEAVQQWVYPLVWQQPLISAVPAQIERAVLEAPLPLLAGIRRHGPLSANNVAFEEGMLIDLTQQSKAVCYQGDESTILPASCYKTLKTALQMEAKQKDDPAMKNLMIAEAFLRFFVDILGDFWKYFSFGELKEGALGKGNVVFDKESFVKDATPKQNQYFLDWFTETAMFNHFIQNMSVIYYERHSNDTKNSESDTKNVVNNTKSVVSDTNNALSDTKNALSDTKNALNDTMKLVDAPLPGFYDLFLDRVKSRSKSEVSKGFDVKSNYKNAVNKRVKLLKTKLMELVT